MRWLKLIIGGFFALFAVAAGIVVTTVVVAIGLALAGINRLTGHRPAARPAVRRPPFPRRHVKRVAAAEVTVTDIASSPRTIPAPVDSAH